MFKGSLDSFFESDNIEDTLMGFEVYRSFGDFFLKKVLLEQSILCYSKALKLKKNDQYCLTKRSKAHVKKNNLNLALEDANYSIKQNLNNFQAILQKARVHYVRGDFETALSYYHQGYRLRPKIEDFLMGIHNSEKAILNSLKSETTFHFRSQEEFHHFYQFAKGYKTYNPKHKYVIVDKRKQSIFPKASVVREVPNFSQINMKKLIPDCQVDYEFLEQFLLDSVEHRMIFNINRLRFQKSKLSHFEEYVPSIIAVDEVPLSYFTATGDRVEKDINDCLKVLTDYCDFWHMHDPHKVRSKQSLNSFKRKWSLLSYDIKESYKNLSQNIEMIYEKQSRGNHIGAICQIKKIIQRIQYADPYLYDALTARRTIMATLYSLMGDSYIELKKYNLAIECHLKDLEIAVEKKSHVLVSRAADNLARTYALMKEYRKTINLYIDHDRLITRLPRSKSVLESVWMRYTLGRCEYKLGNYVGSLNYSEQCFDLIESSKDKKLNLWYIRACILIGQSEFYLENLVETQDRYKLALEKAKELSLMDCIHQIDFAMHDLKKLIAKKEAEELVARRQTTPSWDDSDMIEDEYEEMKMRNLYTALVAKRNKSVGRTMCALPEDD